MSKTDVFLVRHAEAEERETWIDDDLLRPITSAGRKRFEAVLAKHKKSFRKANLLLSSPALRAAQTAETILSRIPELDRITLDALAPDVPVTQLFDALDLVNHTSIILVGHEPQLSSLAWYLMTGDTKLCALKFAKGGILHLRSRVIPRPAHFFLRSLEVPR
jgi:phosphohistidine phosphatase